MPTPILLNAVRVVREALTDGSFVFDVWLSTGLTMTGDQPTVLKLECVDARHAHSLAAHLSRVCNIEIVES